MVEKKIYGKNEGVVLLDGTYAFVTLLLQITLQKHFFK